MSWEFRRRVRYYETDRMGVVHHTNYLRFLEDARMDWMDANIMNYCQMEKEMGLVIPCLHAEGDFKAYLRFDDPFSVSVALTSFTGVRFSFHYEVRNVDTGALCYEGNTTHCFTKGADYHPVAIRKAYPELYEKFQAMVEKDATV